MNYFIEIPGGEKLDFGPKPPFFELIQGFTVETHPILRSNRYLVDHLGPHPVLIHFTIEYNQKNYDGPLMQEIVNARSFYQAQMASREMALLYITNVAKFKGYIGELRTRNMRYDPEGNLLNGTIDFSFYGEFEIPFAEGDADKKDKAVVTGNPAQFIVEIIMGLGIKGENLTNIPYKLTVQGQEFNASTTDGALVDQEVYDTATIGQLTIYADGLDKDPTKSVEVILGEIPDASTVEGAQCRLHNLGFNPGTVDGIYGPNTADALEHFQEKFELEDQSGRLTKETIDQLSKEQGY